MLKQFLEPISRAKRKEEYFRTKVSHFNTFSCIQTPSYVFVPLTRRDLLYRCHSDRIFVELTNDFDQCCTTCTIIVCWIEVNLST
jgi:hypothetical protein